MGIKFLIPLLLDIKEKKRSNRRHYLFHSSLNDRATLNMNVPFTVFTEIQMHVITSTLLEIFNDAPSLLTLDYIMKVLLPETIDWFQSEREASKFNGG